MNRKKLIILCIGIFLFILIVISIIVLSTKKDNKLDVNDNNLEEKIEIEENIKEIDEDNNIEDIIIEDSKKDIDENKDIIVDNKKNDNIKKDNVEKKDNNIVIDNSKEENVIVDNNQNNNTPIITYSCPDGYNLDNNKCISIKDASLECPSNTTSYADDNIPRDKYCINLNEGYEIDNDTCPEGYGLVVILGWGTPDINQCFPLHEKVLVCDDGYSLDNNKCIKIIDANMNNN